MMDASVNTIKMIIAAAIYLLVAIIVAAGLTLSGTDSMVGNAVSLPASYQEAGLTESGTEAAKDSVQRSGPPADDDRFEGLDAKRLVAPAVQVIIRSRPRIVF